MLDRVKRILNKEELQANVREFKVKEEEEKKREECIKKCRKL